MGDVTDFDRTDRPSTAQPAPEHVPGAPSVHDLVIAEVLDLYPFGAPRLRRLLEERRAFGLRKYGTVLQVEDPKRDPTMDALDEFGDALVYLYRAKAHGAPGADELYEEMLQLAARAADIWYRGPKL